MMIDGADRGEKMIIMMLMMLMLMLMLMLRMINDEDVDDNVVGS